MLSREQGAGTRRVGRSVGADAPETRPDGRSSQGGPVPAAKRATGDLPAPWGELPESIRDLALEGATRYGDPPTSETGRQLVEAMAIDPLSTEAAIRGVLSRTGSRIGRFGEYVLAAVQGQKNDYLTRAARETQEARRAPEVRRTFLDLPPEEQARLTAIRHQGLYRIGSPPKTRETCACVACAAWRESGGDCQAVIAAGAAVSRGSNGSEPVEVADRAPAAAGIAMAASESRVAS